MPQFLLEIVFPVIFAIIVVSIIHPKLVRIALIKSIVDNPDARKLNKEPVPVLGGVGVFLGILLTVCLFSVLSGCYASFVVFAAATLMLYTGVVDDILNIKARSKLLLQLIAVAMLIFLGGYEIDNMHGLWGIYGLPGWVSLPLTFIAAVGIINAINLIDGVDGLSSGYGIMASTISGIVFWSLGDSHFTVLSFAIAGSLIPFFVHNCFGRKYKMYIGDGGSLVMGLLFSVIIIHLLKPGEAATMKGVVSFLVALFSVPVFDTLRVMITRIFRGKSPFSPDKTHLHHIFIDMGYSHPATMLMVLGLNLIVLVVWFVTEHIAALSVNAQFYIVCGFAVLTIVGFYVVVDTHRRRRPGKYSVMQQRISLRQIRREGIFKRVQRALDCF